MGAIGTYHVTYRGKKNGESEKGKKWISWQCNVNEALKGAVIPAAAFPEPNLLLFPSDKQIQESQFLQEGQTYFMDLEATVRGDSKTPNYNLIKVHPPKQ